LGACSVGFNLPARVTYDIPATRNVYARWLVGHPRDEHKKHGNLCEPINSTLSNDWDSTQQGIASYASTVQ